MKANELRIGNWVKDDEGTCFEMCELKKETGEYPYHPIELTLEILEKTGFEKNGFNEYEKSISVFDNEYKMLIFCGDYLYLREGGRSGRRMDDDLVVLWNKEGLTGYQKRTWVINTLFWNSHEYWIRK